MSRELYRLLDPELLNAAENLAESGYSMKLSVYMGDLVCEQMINPDGLRGNTSRMGVLEAARRLKTLVATPPTHPKDPQS